MDSLSSWLRGTVPGILVLSVAGGAILIGLQAAVVAGLRHAKIIRQRSVLAGDRKRATLKNAPTDLVVAYSAARLALLVIAVSLATTNPLLAFALAGRSGMPHWVPFIPAAVTVYFVYVGFRIGLDLVNLYGARIDRWAESSIPNPPIAPESLPPTAAEVVNRRGA